MIHMESKYLRLMAVLLGASLSIRGVGQIVEGPAPGDYQGRDLVIEQAPGVILGGEYLNVNRFIVRPGVTVFVRLNASGHLTVRAREIDVQGAINGDGAGWGGSGGAGGGGGGNQAPRRASSGLSGPGATPPSVPDQGNDNGNGGNGANGGRGGEYIGVAGIGRVGGGAGAGGVGGVLGQAVGADRDLAGKPANTGLNDGEDGKHGGHGGYAQFEANGDASTDDSVWMGAGGGAGGGGGGGSASTRQAGAISGGTPVGGGGGGGGGQAGGNGGAIIRLIASEYLNLANSSYLSAKGLWGGGAAGGTAGNRGTAPSKLGGIGGDGGAYGALADRGSGGLGGNGRADGGGKTGGRGGDGGDGGSGAGGGILLSAPRMDLQGAIYNQGGLGPANGGTVKLFYGPDGKQGSPPITTGRLFEGGLNIALAAPAISPMNPPPSEQPVVVTVFNNVAAIEGSYLVVTVDGSDPSPTGPRYTGPFEVLTPKLIRARAFARGFAPSAMAESRIQFFAIPPTFSLEPPSVGDTPYSVAQVLVRLLPDAREFDSILRYEVSPAGVPRDPDENSPVFVPSSPLSVAVNTMIKAKAFREGWSPSRVVSKVINFKPRPVELGRPNGYGEPLPFEVTVGSATPSPFEIWYTVNSGNPIPNAEGASLVTGGKIRITSSGVYRFAVFKNGWNPGDVVERTYNITGGDLTFLPFDPKEFVSDRPIEVTITSPNTDPNLRIRVVRDGNPADPNNPTAVEIANGGKVLITRSSTTLTALAFGPNIAPGVPRNGVYRNVNPSVRLGEALAVPPGAVVNPPPSIPLHIVTNVVENTGGGGKTTNVFAYRHVAFVADSGGGQAFGVVKGFDRVNWWFPQFNTTIEFEQTIVDPDPATVVTLYHTQDTTPSINQQLVVSLSGVPSSIIHYQDFGITGIGTGRTPNSSSNVWIDVISGTPLVRANPPRTGLFALELRDTPPGSGTPGFRGMQIVRVKPYQPDATAFLADLGSELRPEREHEGRETVGVTPSVTLGREGGTFEGYIYQHQRPGQPTHGRIFAIRRNELEHQMEVVWRHADRSGRVIWPYEIRRYTAKWPDKMQLYVRGDRPDPLGPKVSVPAELRPVLVPSQEPIDHAELATGGNASEFSSEIPPLTPEGRCLLFYDVQRDATGVNWVGFEAVRSVRNTDARFFNLDLRPWDIGTEVYDSYHSGPYPAYLPGYLQVPDGGGIQGKPADRYSPVIYGSFTSRYTPFVTQKVLSSWTTNSTTTNITVSVQSTGQIFGVNDGNLEVWWFNVRTNSAWSRGSKIQWPSLVRRYGLRWPAEAPAIVLAQQSQDSPAHNVDPALHHNSDIYYQNSPGGVGYNPNEEHAFIWQGSNGQRVFALRDDLGDSTTSEPFVLHQFQNANRLDARWGMRVYHVITGDPTYPAIAGNRLQPPRPLDGFFDTVELGISGPYWPDRKAQYWAKSAGDDGGLARVTMRYWYPAQVSNFGFLIPGRPDLKDGDRLPWLDIRAQRLGQSAGPGQPINVYHDVRWPENTPILQHGETLVKAKRGLPEILGQKSVEVLYEQRSAPGGLVRLIDPVEGYSLPLEERDIKGSRLIQLPDRFYFEDAPPYLQRRIFYDRLRNQLHFNGAFLEGAAAGFGEDYLQLNVLSGRDLNALNAIAPRDGRGDALRNTLGRLATLAREVRPIGGKAPVFQGQALTAGFATGSGFVTLAFQNNTNLTAPADPVSLAVIRVGAPLYQGEIKVIYPPSPFDEKLTLRHSGDFAGRWDQYEFDWRTLPAGIDPGYREDPKSWAMRGITNAPALLPEEWVRVDSEPPSGVGAVDYTIQGASLLTLSDNWFVCRYRPINPSHPMTGQWSDWTRPALAEGWIKRVIRGNNEFNLGLATQVEEVFRSYQTTSNRTLTSIIGLAGTAYEGNIPLNLESAKTAGLIQIYETILRRGMSLSVDANKDYDPANTALLMAGSRLAQLYGLLGNEAYADAVDPTLTFGAYNGVQIGTFSTSVHAFQNQTAGINSLLQEELALLRGRNDPGVRPFFNRLPPNFTGAAGEAAYVLNYSIGNVLPGEGLTAASAQLLYPQGHGDAWGHYLSSLKTYYRLLRHPYYTWVPRSETVNLVVGGQGSLNVEVDYQDERRFAEVAAAKARTGVDLINLTYRTRYTENPTGQWQGYADEEPNQAWGLSEWAARSGQGALIDWAVGTSLLPDEDLNPAHVRDIQKAERGRIRELGEIAAAYRQIQLQMDQADSGLNPLGLSPNAVPFDLDPNISSPQGGSTHFEQMAIRSQRALRNASQVFQMAQGASGLMREQFDAQEKFTQQVEKQEIDYRSQLITIFGYPYPSDTGRNQGGIYEETYVNEGPDLYHYMLVDPSRIPGLNRGGEQEMTVKMLANQLVRFADGNSQVKNIKFFMSTEGFGMVKPRSWTGERKAPGEIQLAMSDLFQAYGRFLAAAREYDNLIEQIDDQRRVVSAQGALNSAEISTLDTEVEIVRGLNQQIVSLNSLIAEARSQQVRFQNKAAMYNAWGGAVAEAFVFGVIDSEDPNKPREYTFDWGAPIRSAIRRMFTLKGQDAAEDAADQGRIELGIQQAKENAQNESSLQIRIVQRDQIAARGNLAMEAARSQLNQLVRSEANRRLEMYTLQEAMQQAADRYLIALDKGLRVLDELERFRTQTAGELQKYRYRDLLFRVYRNEGIQKYRGQFDVAGRYAYLAAKAYDFETGLLPSDSASGMRALTDIVRARALGLVGPDGEPVATPATGDPGLAGVLGRMKSDWEFVKTRYGINNPDSITLRFSLRRELFRQFGAVGSWRDTLQSFRVANVLDDPIYRRYCIPSHDPASVREPALVIPFATTIQDGLNYFGWVKGPGDSGYSTAYWSTKVRSLGVGLIGYNSALFPRTPRVYLVPVGADMMRVPGHPDRTREFYVVDQVLPQPSALTGEIIGREDFLPIFDSINQPGSFAAIRRIPDFLAYYTGDEFDPITKSNRRLVGRSVWNTRWVLILRGRELNGADPNRGLDDLILGPEVNGARSGVGLTDIQLQVESDSAAGN
jgi:hypothetical protein